MRDVSSDEDSEDVMSFVEGLLLNGERNGGRFERKGTAGGEEILREVRSEVVVFDEVSLSFRVVGGEVTLLDEFGNCGGF